MYLYELICEECGHHFGTVTRGKGTDEVICPKCHSIKLKVLKELCLIPENSGNTCGSSFFG